MNTKQYSCLERKVVDNFDRIVNTLPNLFKLIIYLQFCDVSSYEEDFFKHKMKKKDRKTEQTIYLD